MVTTLGLVVLAYLLGSVPSGYLLVKRARGVDVRRHGSHNIGAINVLRVGGPWLALLTLLCDTGKAWCLVLLAAAVASSPWQIAAAAFSVLVGHAYSAWFLLRERRFSEGKSVASALGVLVSLAQTGNLPWLVLAAPLSVWAIGLVGPRLVTGRWFPISPATMAATVAMPLVACATGAAPPWVALTLAMATLVLVRHKHNLRRLRNATETSVAEALQSAGSLARSGQG